METNGIRYVKRDDIDVAAWNKCIERSANGLLYASSKYLDILSGHLWNALVLGDYEAVMPLPFKRKYGIHYLFQPALLPISGVFGDDLTTDVVEAFLKKIPSKFLLWDIALNHGNRFDRSLYNSFSRANYVLPLSESYENLQSRYHQNIKRNLSKAARLKCIVRKNIPIDAVLEICKTTFPNFTQIDKGLFGRLKQVFEQFINQSITYGVCTSNGRLLASAAFIFFKDRAYYWLAGNLQEGKQVGASSLLVDSFIRDHARSDFILDFEGSDAPTVARFYQRFGATLEPFVTIYHNRLPFPLRNLKPLPAHYQSLLK